MSLVLVSGKQTHIYTYTHSPKERVLAHGIHLSVYPTPYLKGERGGRSGTQFSSPFS